MPETIDQYYHFYKKFALDWWDHIGPQDYVILLSAVGILGYLMMLKGSKRLAS